MRNMTTYGSHLFVKKLLRSKVSFVPKIFNSIAVGIFIPVLSDG